MINLNTLKKERYSSKNSEKLKPLTLGFEEEPKIVTLGHLAKKRLRALENQLRVTGFYTNYWLWNLIFLNFFISLFLGYLVYTSIGTLPNEIGINLNNDSLLDTVVQRELLYVPSLLHLIIIAGVVIVGVKSQKKLHHLYIILFSQQLVLLIFEFIAIRNIIQYFNF